MNWAGAFFLIIAGTAGFILGARAAHALGQFLSGPDDLHDVWDMDESDLP